MNRKQKLYGHRQMISRGVNLLAVYTLGTILIGAPVFYYLTGNSVFLREGTLGSTLLLIVVIFNVMRSYEVANVLLYLVMNLLTMRAAAYAGESEDMQLSYFFLFSLIFIVFDQTMTRLFCILIILVRIILFELNVRYFPGEVDVLTEGNREVIHWTLNGVMLSLILLVFYLYVRWARKAEKLAKKKSMFAEEMIHDMRAAYLAHSGLCTTLKLAIDDKTPLEDTAGVVNELMETHQFFKYVMNNLLDYSIFESGTFEDVHYEGIDITSEIEKIVSVYMYVAAKKGISIRFTIDGDLPRIIQADRIKVLRIIINLLSNAIKFAPDGTPVDVNVMIDSKRWVLSVANEGKTISAEEVRTLFLPYNEKVTDPGQGKKGLGLPITKELVELLGGEIWVKSALNKPTSFNVAVPFY